MGDAAFYRATRVAVVRYVREVALLPSFPSEEPTAKTLHDEDKTVHNNGVAGAVVRVLATDQVSGQVLPRTEDTWLAVRPFQDISKSTLPAWATALVERRMAAVALLVRLSTSPQFGWNPMMDCGGQKPSENPPNLRRSFWLALMRDLDPDAFLDRSMGLERCVVALSCSPSPRFLLCVDRDPSQIDFADLLDQFLWADKMDVTMATGENQFGGAMDACKLPRGAVAHCVIELGLSFTTGKITHTMISKLFDVLQRLCSSQRRADCIGFRITTLRFGTGCSIQPKAFEIIRDRWGPALDLTSVSLGSIDGIKPVAVQECLVRLVSEPASKLRRLGVAAGASFPAFASLFRVPSPSTVEEVDVRYDPSEENAAWLAYAFFHADSQSSVSSLCLRTTKDQSFFSEEWINVFERTMQSHTPSKDLAGEVHEEENEGQGERNRSFVTIQAATPVKSHPYSGAKLLCKLDRGQEGEMLVQVKNLVGVVFPGLGVGWVPAGSVLATRSERSKRADGIQTNGRVTSLAIERTAKVNLRANPDQQIASMLRLLRLVGKPLECLQLPDCQFNSNHLTHILRYCPKLKELNISGHRVDSIDPLVNAYAVQQCQIEALSLSHPYTLANDDAKIEELTRMLGQQPSCKVPLRRLVMHLVSDRATGLARPKCSTEVATKLAVVLSQNAQLEFVQLTAQTPLPLGPRPPVDPLPLDFLMQYLSEPLAMDCKLAFLSVVFDKHEAGKREQSDTSSVWRRLDAQVLSLIFSFSRQAVARHVLRCP